MKTAKKTQEQLDGINGTQSMIDSDDRSIAECLDQIKMLRAKIARHRENKARYVALLKTLKS